MATTFEPVTPALTRRAWNTLLLAFLIFAIFVTGTALTASWVYDHATARRNAEATVISGTGALWRDSPDSEWRIFDQSIGIREGDEISTELGTVVWITLFDGSTLEVTERSHVRFDRMRRSRFSDETQQARLHLVHGTIYVTLAPVTDVELGELEIVAAGISAVVRDTSSDETVLSPSFVIESHDRGDGSDGTYRVAAFRGSVAIETAADTIELSGPEQYEVDDEGHAKTGATIRSEVLVNGDFSEGLDGWEQVYTAEGREPRERVGIADTMVDDEAQDDWMLRIFRPDSTIWARTGIRQSIERTLRLPAALTLEFDLRINAQGEPIGGRQTIPIAIELDYIDILGQEREWTTAYAIRSGDEVLDANAYTTVIPGRWTHVIVDLHNLEPIPKVLDTIVVYAIGSGYDSYLSNLSLTTGEGNSAS